MRARWPRAVVAASLAAHTTALAQKSAPFFLGDPSQWGHVTHLVEPRYPQRALDLLRSGYVDVRGRVNPHGVLEQVSYSPDKRASGVFIDPLRRVVRDWRFEPPLGADCQPSAQRVVNRVWFQIENGKPKIAVAVLPEPARAAATIVPVKREEPALRAPPPAAIYARMHVDAAGDVVSVEPRSYTRGRARGVREAEHEVIRALTQWKFPPAAPGASRLVCYPLKLR